MSNSVAERIEGLLGALVANVKYHDEARSVLLSEEQWRAVEEAWYLTKRSLPIKRKSPAE